MIYITGDCHRDFQKLFSFSKKMKLTEEDVIILLGDVGLNYFGKEEDKKKKKELAQKVKAELFCIQGNHEQRPENLSDYSVQTKHEGQVWIEKEYPNIVFAKNGEAYNLNGKSILVLGGAYSVDKYYRLSNGWHWFADEQMSEEEKEYAFRTIEKHDNRFDYIFSHTCPESDTPTEMFLEGIDQKSVDHNMEEFLEKVKQKTEYEKWYCGHWHTNKQENKIHFLFNEIVPLEI